MGTISKSTKQSMIIGIAAFLVIIFSVVCYMFAQLQKTQRDAERIDVIRQVQQSLESYRSMYGMYPTSTGEVDGEWDTPTDGTFAGIEAATLLSPDLYDRDTSNLRYQRFAPGSFGCTPENGSFYVLGFVDMETSNGDHPLSPAWVCPNRNFQNEMEFVVGKFEN